MTNTYDDDKRNCCWFLFSTKTNAIISGQSHVKYVLMQVYLHTFNNNIYKLVYCNCSLVMISKPVYLYVLFEKYLAWTLFIYIQIITQFLQTKIEWKTKNAALHIFCCYCCCFVYSTMQCGFGYLYDTKHMWLFFIDLFYWSFTFGEKYLFKMCKSNILHQ